MRTRTLLLLCASALVAAGLLSSPAFAAPGAGKVDAALRGTLSRSSARALIPVIVTMNDHAGLTGLAAITPQLRQTMAIRELQSVAGGAQAPLIDRIGRWKSQGLVTGLQRFWIFDGFALRATPGVIASLAARADVARVSLDATRVVPAGLPGRAASVAASVTPEPNITLINAPSMWAQGFTGQGEVVATLDTGVDMTNPDLAASWRGGTDSWFDPYGQHPSFPVDIDGHGTQVLGVIVGGGAGGTAIGVAPGAKWISAKIFDDRGSATDSAIHAGFQWLLDPDGNPATPDAPDVVDNSWTFANAGCDLTFQPDLQALRASGILPVFAAGNGGPSANTSYSPANNPEAFAVGATDNADNIASFSSLGPTTCGGSTGAFPEMVAPGVGINTSDRYGFFTSVDGTSISAPQLAGALALLLSARPDLTPDQQEAALTDGAVDLGIAGPDDVFGYGRLDVLAAYEQLPSASELFSIKVSGDHTLGSLNGVQPKDVVAFDGTNYSMVFDGSDVGVVKLDAMARLSTNSLLMSFAWPVTLPGLGPVDDSDIVRFDATSLGPTTAGTFSMWFHGADVGLTTYGEDIDSLELLADGRILISTHGWASVPGLSGIHREDVLAFTPTSLGATTAGTFAYYLDGSDVGLTTSTENVDSIDVDTDGHVALSTTGAFSVTGLSGTGNDVFECVPSSIGANSACTFTPTLVLNGAAAGLAGLGMDDFHR